MTRKYSKKLAKRVRSSQRLRYSDAEARYPWLTILLDTYHIIDVGISVELPDEEKKRNDKVACRQGCGNCCLRPKVPITELEVLGISWFATEVLDGEVKGIVKNQLLHHREAVQCAFLVNGICSVYPVRPIACRMFFVFGSPCQPGEDVSQTRPHDMYTIGVAAKDLGLLDSDVIMGIPLAVTGKSPYFDRG